MSTVRKSIPRSCIITYVGLLLFKILIKIIKVCQSAPRQRLALMLSIGTVGRLHNNKENSEMIQCFSHFLTTHSLDSKLLTVRTPVVGSTPPKNEGASHFPLPIARRKVLASWLLSIDINRGGYPTHS